MKERFLAFIAEQFPFALSAAMTLDAKALRDHKQATKSLTAKLSSAFDCETTPFVTAQARFDQEAKRLGEAIEGFFARERTRNGITPEQKRWILKGMILTRAVDLWLKKIFLSSALQYKDLAFQGKGFRSLGQEAIYAAALFLRRGDAFRVNGEYKGDVVAPLIRDMGLALAFTDDVESALNAQAGKEGAPTNGRDLHIGDYSRGVWPPAAPLAIASCSIVGVAQAMQMRNEQRVAFSFIGEGGSSLGEWHEAINFAATRKLPVVFCIQNNQTALSTALSDQSAVRLFGDKGLGYGVPHVTVDGTDPEAIASAFAWAADRARAGEGAALIELVCMRMCGHAHHDDMLYLGHEPAPSFDYPKPSKGGYVDVDRYQQWAAKDPIKNYAQKLIKEGACTQKGVDNFKREAEEACEAALERIKARPWPKALKKEALNKASRALEVERGPAFQKEGATYMEAIAQAVYEQMGRDEKVYMLGEDVGLPYGNAFMMFRAAPQKLWPRFINTPIAESAIVGALVGMAAEGLRPIGEMQFNDFSASAFNQLVNNAAKLRYRTGISAPFVLRMPWGGLRRAGPYHSQDTIPWFHRSFGFRIVAPSTPHDARALFHAAMTQEDPVLFYEHINLYRDPSIKQVLGKEIEALPFGKAALRKAGTDLTLVSYGAYVHRVLAVAERLEAESGITCDVIDLRSLMPLDFEAITASLAKTSRVLLVGEDSRTGSFLESLASRIAEELFESLDAPVCVIGAEDTPIPYSPSLEDAFLPSHDDIFNKAKSLIAW